ncbi:hypothetical protein FBU30_003079, partial [Linnemannia zychae]
MPPAEVSSSTSTTASATNVTENEAIDALRAACFLDGAYKEYVDSINPGKARRSVPLGVLNNAASVICQKKNLGQGEIDAVRLGRILRKVNNLDIWNEESRNCLGDCWGEARFDDDLKEPISEISKNTSQEQLRTCPTSLFTILKPDHQALRNNIIDTLNIQQEHLGDDTADLSAIVQGVLLE